MEYFHDMIFIMGPREPWDDFINEMNRLGVDVGYKYAWTKDSIKSLMGAYSSLPFRLRLVIVDEPWAKEKGWTLERIRESGIGAPVVYVVNPRLEIALLKAIHGLCAG